ncbi:MAG: hypothetical protein F4160_07730 [Rhodospirillaceae bacterium]|nr:hypothetical protein [Rhodospirillaceae bacterium]
MIDLDRLRRALVLGALGAAATALLLPSLALMRYTDAHDWYAARKVSVAQALIAVGFDERASTKYRLADGRTVTWLRDGVATYPAARESRSLILAVIGDNILLGAIAGFVAVFTLSGLLNLARHEAAGVSGAAARRSLAAERRPGFVEGVPPYAAHEPNRVPARAAPAGVGPLPNAAVPSPEPPVEAEPEAAYEPPARPRGRWF